MELTSAKQLPVIKTRVANLRRRHHDLGTRIDDELRRPAPCCMTLQQFKRQRLRLKDQIARYDGLLRGVDRSRLSGQAV